MPESVVSRTSWDPIWMHCYDPECGRFRTPEATQPIAGPRTSLQRTPEYYALERFLYRLGASPYHDRFVLKGALMFTVWATPFLRPTRDIDLLGHLDNTPERIVTAVDIISTVQCWDKPCLRPSTGGERR